MKSIYIGLIVLSIILLLCVLCVFGCYNYNQKIFKYISAIPTTPVISRECWEKYIPELKIFENNWQTILCEYESIKDMTTPIKGDQYFDIIIPSNKSQNWKKFYMKWYGPIKLNARKVLPKTSCIIDKCPNVQLAMFSILEPGAEILPHEGPYRGSVRVHLGLDCPSISEGCSISIRGKKYGWENGKLLVWDDTYVHSVRNESNKPRVILFMDVTRPVKNNIFAHAFQKLGHLCARYADRDN